MHFYKAIRFSLWIELQSFTALFANRKVLVVQTLKAGQKSIISCILSSEQDDEQALSTLRSTFSTS